VVVGVVVVIAGVVVAGVVVVTDVISGLVVVVGGDVVVAGADVCEMVGVAVAVCAVVDAALKIWHPAKGVARAGVIPSSNKAPITRQNNIGYSPFIVISLSDLMLIPFKSIVKVL
jgi:hypothetical protein